MATVVSIFRTVSHRRNITLTRSVWTGRKLWATSVQDTRTEEKSELRTLDTGVEWELWYTLREIGIRLREVVWAAGVQDGFRLNVN